MLSVRAVTLIPVELREGVAPGDNLVDKLETELRRQRQRLQTGDVVVVKHKIVSKAEGRIVRLDDVRPSRTAKAWSRMGKADARVVQLALNESRNVLRKKVVAGRGVLITETKQGLVCANSGVDVSNVDGGTHAVLLPKDPDQSATRLRRAIKKKLGVSVALIISDSFGRPWREGLTDVAIGAAGIKPVLDHRGKRDPHGYELHASAAAVADELACAAGLVCGKLSRTPFCIVRGAHYQAGRGSARELIRPLRKDLFR
jgi:coenzyme F420-0:L-glutamate ligase / coenzyme F420-1:gamma-L-glutamate ligase